MELKYGFNDFFKAIKVDNLDEINKTISGIVDKLDSKYYEGQTNQKNYYLVGSMGRGTSIKGESDIDLLYILPREVKRRINSYEVNGQSALLQEIKNFLKEKYSQTDLKGDGQVVDLFFQKYTVELVPAFENDDGSFDYPDTHDGGSWKVTKPLQEINECSKMQSSYPIFFDLCRLLRSWKSENGVRINGLLIDTKVCNFLIENQNYKYLNFNSLDASQVAIELLEYLATDDKDRKQWNSLGSNQIIENRDYDFVQQAKSSIKDIKNSDDEDELWQVYRSLLGQRFPKPPEPRYQYTDKEQFIENMFECKVKYKLKIDCNVSQNGFRNFSLRDLLSGKLGLSFLALKKKLEFFVETTDCPYPYDIYWKVKNVGTIAKKRDCLRGQIVKGESIKKESTDFNGPHYVECYLVKNNVCVARNKIKVPIKGN